MTSFVVSGSAVKLACLVLLGCSSMATAQNDFPGLPFGTEIIEMGGHQLRIATPGNAGLREEPYSLSNTMGVNGFYDGNGLESAFLIGSVFLEIPTDYFLRNYNNGHPRFTHRRDETIAGYTVRSSAPVTRFFLFESSEIDGYFVCTTRDLHAIEIDEGTIFNHCDINVEYGNLFIDIDTYFVSDISLLWPIAETAVKILDQYKIK
ncbi:hypothetical protein [Roseobacter sp. HKCCA0434]|uniref:hypothetical protein n=1 Tax=Roseobacter sp. HKCCA0434 TaxID=3079297 RepID=UPI0029059B77|nr:hypothetical protein [Roseobacter sp. HKCCA0434]